MEQQRLSSEAYEHNLDFMIKKIVSFELEPIKYLVTFFYTQILKFHLKYLLISQILILKQSGASFTFLCEPDCSKNVEPLAK